MVLFSLIVYGVKRESFSHNQLELVHILRICGLKRFDNHILMSTKISHYYRQNIQNFKVKKFEIYIKKCHIK